MPRLAGALMVSRIQPWMRESASRMYCGYSVMEIAEMRSLTVISLPESFFFGSMVSSPSRTGRVRIQYSTEPWNGGEGEP